MVHLALRTVSGGAPNVFVRTQGHSVVPRGLVSLFEHTPGLKRGATVRRPLWGLGKRTPPHEPELRTENRGLRTPDTRGHPKSATSAQVVAEAVAPE